MNSTVVPATFTPTGPAFQVVRRLPTGALRIAGYLTRWEIDQQRDRFIPGSFAGAIDEFMNSRSQPLAWHHRAGAILGQVESLAEDDRGVQLVAQVDYREPDEGPLRTAYEGILTGTITGLSVGGFFDRLPRRETQSYDIYNVSKITECSVTHAPVLGGGRASFRIIDAGERPFRDALVGAELARIQAELFLAGQSVRR